MKSSSSCSLVCFLVVLAAFVTISAAAMEEEHDTQPPTDCVAEWDPFCPQGTPSEDDWPYDDTYPNPCVYCELTPTGGKCSQVAEGQTGRHNCTTTWIGTDPVYCTTSGEFCENISVTP